MKPQGPREDGTPRNTLQSSVFTLFVPYVMSIRSYSCSLSGCLPSPLALYWHFIAERFLVSSLHWSITAQDWAQAVAKGLSSEYVTVLRSDSNKNSGTHLLRGQIILAHSCVTERLKMFVGSSHKLRAPSDSKPKTDYREWWQLQHTPASCMQSQAVSRSKQKNAAAHTEGMSTDMKTEVSSLPSKCLL